MTPPGLIALRLAATLAHAVPGVRLRLRLDEGKTVDVARVPHPAIVGLGPGSVVGSCAFRERVAEAHRAQRARSGAFDGPMPAIDVGVPPGGCVHPGGIVRVCVDRVEVIAFATTVAPAECARLFATRPGGLEVHLYHDGATEVTLVHVEAAPRARRAVLALLEDLLAACVAEELVGEAGATEGGGVDPPGRRQRRQ
jgi:hypothetical protein